MAVNPSIVIYIISLVCIVFGILWFLYPKQMKNYKIVLFSSLTGMKEEEQISMTKLSGILLLIGGIVLIILTYMGIIP